MLYYFNNAGEPYTPVAETGDEAVAQNLAIKSEVPEGLEPWRLSLNLDTNAVIVAYEGMSEEDALAQRLIDEQAAYAAILEVAKAAEAELTAATA